MFSSKKFAGLVVALSLFAFALAPAVRADGLNATQISSILSMLQAFGADQSVINNVSAALGGSASATNQSCLNLSQNLTLGSTGSDVTNLQNYLAQKGYFSAGATGYYGFVTAQAVGQLQLSLGIVSSQNDTAYGLMGPKTRASVGCGGNIVTLPPVQPQVPVVFKPTTGMAPLQITAAYPANSVSNNIAIDFGDGTPLIKAYNNVNSEADGGAICGQGSGAVCSIGHTFKQAGTYTVKFEDSNGTVVSSQTITVTGGQTSSTPTATIDQSSLTTTSLTPTITGTVTNTSWICVYVGSGPLPLRSTGPDSIPGYKWGDCNASGVISMTNGRWSMPMRGYTGSTLTPGTYTVGVYNVPQNSESGILPLLVSGILTVNSNQTTGTPTVAIDQSSLFSTSATPVIKLQESGDVPLHISITNAQDTVVYAASQDDASFRGAIIPVTCISHPCQSFSSWWANVTPLSNGTYTVVVTNTSNNTVLAKGILTVNSNQTSGTPTATINPSSLTGTAGSITVSGTASGVAVIFQTPYGSISAIPVVNGRWSTSVAITSPGSYPVSVKDYITGNVLASDTLVVTIASSTASASIDSASLITTSNKPTISGTASGSNYFNIVIKASAGYGVWQSPLTVTDGRWSTTVTVPLNGTYTVTITAGSPNPVVVSSSTLTVTAH